MKKTIVAVAASMFFVGTTVYANEAEPVITPEDSFYDTSKLVEELEFELTEDRLEKLLLVDEYSEERLVEIEALLDAGDVEGAQSLLTEYEAYLVTIEEELEAIEEEETEESTEEETTDETEDSEESTETEDGQEEENESDAEEGTNEEGTDEESTDEEE